MKLNLGCYLNTKKGYINIDIEKFTPEVEVLDLNKIPYPFKTNSCTKIIMRGILDHLRADLTNSILDELHRISQPNALIYITSSFGANYMRALDHTRGFTFRSFKSLTKAKGTHGKRGWNASNKNWEIVHIDAEPSFFGKLLPKFIRNPAGEHFNGLLRNINVTLRVVK